jgi:DNA-binding transcriptional LysR family regulator
MHDINLSGLDLNLVPALDALLRRRNVTRAAEEVGLSQPAMSRALARLRDLQGDPLLVRTRTGYVLTPRAQAIQPRLAQAVAQLKGVFQTESFDPAAVRRTVRLAAGDTQAILLLPEVVARLAAEAPGVDLRVEPYGPDILDRLESGSLDLVFALGSTPLPPGVHSEAVGDDELALVTRRGHPAAGRAWSLADYGDWGHVGVAIVGDGRSEIDAMLAAHGVTRRMVLVTPYFTAALATVASTDLVTTVSAAMARRFATAFGLVLQPPPFADTRLTTTLVCSHVRAADPFLIWFRGLVREIASGTPVETPFLC